MLHAMYTYKNVYKNVLINITSFMNEINEWNHVVLDSKYINSFFSMIIRTLHYFHLNLVYILNNLIHFFAYVHVILQRRSLYKMKENACTSMM